MNIILFIIFIGCLYTSTVVRATDFLVSTYGAIPSDGKMDTQGINAALNAASKVPNSRVIFHSGTYNINGTLMLSIGTNITIEGNGATVIGSTPVMAFYILNCNGFVLRNLVIDWSPVPFTAGKVVNSTKYSLDIQVANGHVASNRTCEEITKYNGTTNYWYANIVWAQRTSKVPSILLNSNTMRIPFDTTTGAGWWGSYFPVGSDLVCRHYVYEGPAFTASSCQNVLIDNFVVYTSPGMGITAKHCTNVTVINSQVTPRKPRWASTTADGSHFLNLRGSLNVINTTIQGMGDDCMNVHNDYFKVKSVNSTTVILGYGVGGNLDAIFVNDIIGFSNLNDPFNYAVRKTVRTTLRDFAKGICTVTAWTSGIVVDEWAVIMNTPYIHINNYTAGYNKGRGIVLQTSKGSLIENSKFTLTNGVAVSITCDVVSWGEGNCGGNAVLRNNQINYVNQVPFRAHETGDISIYAVASATANANPSAHTNITIEQNTFIGTVKYGVNVASANRVTIRDNKFLSPGTGVLTICNATHVVAQHNTYMQLINPLASSLITFDPSCAPNGFFAYANNLTFAFFP